MSSICDADLHHVKPGKKVMLKSFHGSLTAPQYTAPSENYWQLIGCKAVVSQSIANNSERVLITFEQDFQRLGLTCHNELPNSLWVLLDDLKFVCRY